MLALYLICCTKFCLQRLFPFTYLTVTVYESFNSGSRCVRASKWFFSNGDDAVNLAVSRECEGQLETKRFTKRTFLSQISALDKKKSGNLKRLIDD